ncbi:MAG TPA: Sec-independent protein translocase protein TatB [Steroidobacteraceae bacterium]|jgi:Tat protein translocase TatB subunit
MFEVGFTEILLILGIALLVLGPEKLPGLAEKVGRWTGRARAMARQLRTQLEHEVTMEEMARTRPPPAPPPPAPNPPEASASSAAPAGPELDLDAKVSGIEQAPHDTSAADAAADAAVAADAPLTKSAP